METPRQNLTAILEQVLILAEAFGVSLSAARQEIYCEALADLPPQAVQQAVWKLIRTHQYHTMPTIADIRQAAGAESLSPDDQALLAWGKLSWAIDACGWDNSIAFDDPAIMQAVTIWAGSWSALRDLDWNLEQVQWRKREFMHAYKLALAGGNTSPPYFRGSYERNNLEHGYTDLVPPVMFISGTPGTYTATPTPQTQFIDHATINETIGLLENRLGTKLKMPTRAHESPRKAV